MPAAKPAFPVLQMGHPLARGLVLGVPLYQGSGLTAYDLSGAGRNGTLSGGATWAAGQSGYCLSTNGSTSYADFGTSTALIPASAFTISLWVNTPAPTTSSGQLAARDSNSSFSWGVRFNTTTAKLQCFVNLSGTPTINGAVVLSANLWYHVVFLYDGAAIRLYVNGAADGSASASGSVSQPAGVPTSLGRRSDGSLYLQARFDAFSIHSRGLSAAEVAALYADSWAMYRPRRRLTWFVPAAGASVGGSDGTSSATGTGASLAASAGASAGTGAATAVGASLAAAAGSAAGVGTATAGGAGLAAAIGASAGVGTATAAGASLAASDGAAAGTGAVSGVGAALAAADGAAAGTGTVSGQGASLAAADGATSGTSTVTAVGASLAAAVGSAAGTATAVGHASGASDGTAEGTSTVLGVGASLVAADGASAGTGSATGTGAALQAAAGSASGSATVAGAGAALASAAGDGAGTGAVFGAGAALWAALGAAAGASTVLGVSPSSTTGGYYFRRYILSRRG